MLGNANQVLRAAAREILSQRQLSSHASIKTFKKTIPPIMLIWCTISICFPSYSPAILGCRRKVGTTYNWRCTKTFIAKYLVNIKLNMKLLINSMCVKVLSVFISTNLPLHLNKNKLLTQLKTWSKWISYILTDSGWDIFFICFHTFILHGSYLQPPKFTIEVME